MSDSPESPDAEVLDPAVPIIDSHHHLYDRPGGRYLMEDYLADASTGHNIVATVYVENQSMTRSFGPALLRPVGEVEFANGVGAMSDAGGYGPARICAGIVGFADLTAGEQIGELLDSCIARAPDRYRGVRQATFDHPTDSPYRLMANPPPRGIMEHPRFRSGLRQVALRDLSFDVTVLHHQLPTICDLADEVSDLTFVVEHLGIAISMEEDGDERGEIFEHWRKNLREVAARPNVVCKIGGFGMPFWGFGFDTRPSRPGYDELAAAWRPYVETGIDLFGPERCMMESNFPRDRRSCDFSELWNAMKHIVGGHSTTDKAALFAGTASRVYRLGV